MMDKKINKTKFLMISVLPIMWLVYFIFEIVTGRVVDSYSFLLNLSLTVIFAAIGWIIYSLSTKYTKGFSSTSLLILFVILMVIDQGSKILIQTFFFKGYFEIIPKFLSFNPIINTDGSWLNARFGLGVGFPVLIIINTIAIILFFELNRYYNFKGNKSFCSDMCFLFILSGALCSLIDKVFYGGSLDFIGISNLFVADIKDIYINLAILFFICEIYMKDYLSDDSNSTLKEDLQSIKRFFLFCKNDILKLIKKEKV